MILMISDESENIEFITIYSTKFLLIPIRKVHLEAEIIIYRHLLGLDEREETAMVISQPPAVRSEMVGKYMINNKKKGSIGISKNSIFIITQNQDHRFTILNARRMCSKWSFRRFIESFNKQRYRCIKMDTRSACRFNYRISLHSA